MKVINCLTEALRIGSTEYKELVFWPSHDKDVSDISLICQKFGRNFRPATPDEKPVKNEWLIVFWGLFVSVRDYEGNPEEYDYHFAFSSEGKWFHRLGLNGEFEEINLKEYIKSFDECNVKPQFFIISEAE